MILRLRREYETQVKYHILLMSDVHIGSVNLDKQLLTSDLDWALHNNAMVFINGDLFDLILPKDNKRFNPSTLDTELLGSDNIINSTLDLGIKLLKPYASIIEGIGVGNHEVATTKHCSCDIIELFLERFNLERVSLPPVQRMGYKGAISILFTANGGRAVTYNIFYHHGMGSNAPVTKGMIDFNRTAVQVENYDVLWMGHKHTRFVDTVRRIRIPKEGELLVKDIKHVMTGSYEKDDLKKQIKDNKYCSDFVIEKNFAPAGRGGARLSLVVNTGPPTRVIAEAMI